MAAAPLTLERAHALDAPMLDFDIWLDKIVFGLCTACGRDAWSGISGWWHDEGPLLCPERHKRTPSFSPDEPE